MNQYQKTMSDHMNLIRGSDIERIRGTGYGKYITVTYKDGSRQSVSQRTDGTLYDLDTGKNIVTPEQVKYVREIHRLKKERRCMDEIQR